MNKAQEYCAIDYGNHGVATKEEIAMEVARIAGYNCDMKKVVEGRVVAITRDEVFETAERLGVKFY